MPVSRLLLLLNFPDCMQHDPNACRMVPQKEAFESDHASLEPKGYLEIHSSSKLRKLNGISWRQRHSPRSRLVSPDLES